MVRLLGGYRVGIWGLLPEMGVCMYAWHAHERERPTGRNMVTGRRRDGEQRL